MKCFVVGLIIILGFQIKGNTEVEKNYQINGSFEYATNPDIPDYWAGVGTRYRANGLPWEICTEKGIKEFREKFFLDSSEAFVGKKSIRIERPFHLIGMKIPLMSGKEYTVSAYLKSEFDDRRIQIGVTSDSMDKPIKTKDIVSSRKWQRYELHLADYPSNKMTFFVKPLDTGKTWVDAVQIEAGGKATPFIPSHFDKGFKLPLKPVHPKPGTMSKVPEVIIKSPLPAPPVIDGDLNDSAWKNAPTVKMNDYMGASSSTDTEVKLAYDKKNIYMGFVCADPGKAMGIGESIEIFVDMLGIGDPFYQFIFDAKGKKYNYRSVTGVYDWKWQAGWDAKVKMGKDGWTAEAVIPFDVMPDAKELAGIHSLRMNFCRNYSAGPEKYLSWSPIKVGFLEPDRFGKVVFGAVPAPVQLTGLSLKSVDPVDAGFDLTFSVKNNSKSQQNLTASVCLESENRPAQFKTAEIKLAPSAQKTISIPGMSIDVLRCRASVILTNKDGKKEAHIRDFLDVPHPWRIYPEYSFYSSEKNARIAMDYKGNPQLLRDSKVLLTLKLRGYPRTLVEKEYTPKVKSGRQLFTIPINQLRGGLVYNIEAQLIDKSKNVLMKTQTDLHKYNPNFTEVKVNRLNRGVYLNGKPYIPYGILITYFENKQLRYYKKCGFDFISLISHWRGQEQNIEFMKNCEGLGINVIPFHVARPRLTPPAEALADYRDRKCKSLIGFIPNDEEGDRVVYDIAEQCQFTYPEVLTCVNHNFSSYKAFDNRLLEMPGDVLSIDRYPLLMLPKGRPQTTSEIYSVERCIEIMDRDGERERKPLFFWMQAGERFSKEPTPAEITWLTYILLVNHCVGFTYFGGVPSSKYVWGAIRSINKEIQALKPYLFSLEEDPDIGHGNDQSREYIRVLAKKLGNTLTLICVNRAMEPIDAAIDLSAVSNLKARSAVVLFENRNVKLQKKILKDKFAPLARHVYKIRIK